VAPATLDGGVESSRSSQNRNGPAVSHAAFLLRRWLARALSKLGDAGYDRAHGVRTAGVVETGEMADVQSPRRAGAMRYEPTRARPFRRFLEALDLPRDGTFVDIGCGRGRVLVMAAQMGFRRVVGVEFSPVLCRQARENVAALHEAGTVIDVVEEDAALYRFEPDQNVIYMFNPFDEAVMNEVLDRIDESLREAPRTIWLVYQHPEARAAIEGRDTFTRVASMRTGGTEFVAYRNRPV